MPNPTNPCGLGYGKPPKHTQFAKGQSGNPKGRPKGSQNLATILDKACRQRVRVTENGRIHYITKFEATMLQLCNLAASGELRAIAELYEWIKYFAESAQTVLTPAAPNENDKAVMASICDRLRNSEPVTQDDPTDAPDTTKTNPLTPKE